MGPPTMILVEPDRAQRRDLRSMGAIEIRSLPTWLDSAGSP
jgi:hypothetical protein